MSPNLFLFSSQKWVYSRLASSFAISSVIVDSNMDECNLIIGYYASNTEHSELNNDNITRLFTYEPNATTGDDCFWTQFHTWSRRVGMRIKIQEIYAKKSESNNFRAMFAVGLFSNTVRKIYTISIIVRLFI